MLSIESIEAFLQTNTNSTFCQEAIDFITEHSGTGLSELIASYNLVAEPAWFGYFFKAVNIDLQNAADYIIDYYPANEICIKVRAELDYQIINGNFEKSPHPLSELYLKMHPDTSAVNFPNAYWDFFDFFSGHTGISKTEICDRLREHVSYADAQLAIATLVI